MSSQPGAKQEEKQPQQSEGEVRESAVSATSGKPGDHYQERKGGSVSSSSDTCQPTSVVDSDDTEAAHGYDLYPERVGRKYNPSFWEHIFLHEGETLSDQINCEKNVYNCFKKSYGVRLMLAALKASGCPIDISRNVSCETCEHVVTGGYDPSTNQIVVCQNVARRESMVQGILVHELIHMFDFCTKQLDFTSLEHLACTEIRAANLTHCSYISSIMQGDSSPVNIRQTHQACVKNKASCSLVAARGVTKREAVRIVDLVFPKCYNDLEPIGRRVRRSSDDIRRAYLDRHRFGYV